MEDIVFKQKNFSLTEKEIELIRKETRRRGIGSHSAALRQLLKEWRKFMEIRDIRETVIRE